MSRTAKAKNDFEAAAIEAQFVGDTTAQAQMQALSADLGREMVDIAGGLDPLHDLVKLDTDLAAVTC